MKKWLIVMILLDQNGQMIETIECRFDTYQECIEYQKVATSVFIEDIDVFNYKFTIVNV